MKPINIAITAASFSGNKGAAAMLKSSISQLKQRYGERLNITLMSTYPDDDRRLIEQLPEKYDFIKVVNAKPARLMFVAFPLALLYSFMRFVPPLGWLFRLNGIIGAYSKTDFVIDEAGISFVDSRGIVMNIYAFVCAAVPMLCGVPVAKYSQAIGAFHKRLNRLLARLVLPKMKLICARGEETLKNLHDIGISDNVRLCADGAFTMADSAYYDMAVEKLCGGDDFYSGKVVALSLSSVVDKKCRRLGIDYKRCMVQLVEYLNSRGFNVLIIANAAREGSSKPRNNDLMICSQVYECCADKRRVRWYPREMSPEELRGLISRCCCLVGSRFHAMIGALEKCVPVLLVGWSHKYKEVLDMFGLGAYAVDYSKLETGVLYEKIDSLIAQSDSIRAQIAAKLPEVKKSSLDNIVLISREIDCAVGIEKP